MAGRRNLPAILALALIGIIAPRFATAQTLRDLRVCGDVLKGGDPGAAIRACSVFIDTRRSVGGRVPLPNKALWAILGFRGLAHYKRGEISRAIQDFNESIATRPQEADVYIYRSNAYSALGDTERALQDLIRAAELAPGKKNPIFFENVAMFYFDVFHDAPNALKYFSRSIALKRTPVALLKRSIVYKVIGDDEHAAADYTAAIQADGSDRRSLEGGAGLMDHWLAYLKEIQDADDYPNWSGPPLDMFRHGAVASNAQVQPSEAAASRSTPSSGDCTQAEAHWKSVEDIKTVAAYEDHVARFPNCAFATLARARIAALSGRDAAGKSGAARECPAGTTADSDGDCVREKSKKREAPARRAAEHHVQRNGAGGGAGPLDCANVANIMACAGRAISTAPVVNGNR